MEAIMEGCLGTVKLVLLLALVLPLWVCTGCQPLGVCCPDAGPPESGVATAPMRAKPSDLLDSLPTGARIPEAERARLDRLLHAWDAELSEGRIPRSLEVPGEGPRRLR
jgi:hypothetical protein